MWFVFSICDVYLVREKKRLTVLRDLDEQSQIGVNAAIRFCVSVCICSVSIKLIRYEILLIEKYRNDKISFLFFFSFFSSSFSYFNLILVFALLKR